MVLTTTDMPCTFTGDFPWHLRMSEDFHLHTRLAILRLAPRGSELLDVMGANVLELNRQDPWLVPFTQGTESDVAHHGVEDLRMCISGEFCIDEPIGPPHGLLDNLQLRIGTGAT